MQVLRTVLILTLALTCSSIKILSAEHDHPNPWQGLQLSRAPRVFPVVYPREEGMRALFFEGPKWLGKPTRVFAWVGIPRDHDGRKVPAIVLVHGGLGTAFADWVKLWNDRGYAAIAIDTCGSMPTRGFGEPQGLKKRLRHDFAGPPCWDDSFDQVQWSIRDQWTYHAVADILLARALLASFPEIDADRIGITGISWGGYLTAIAASVDPHFRFAAPVYGCGFLGQNSAWLPDFAKMGPAAANRWLKLWDPSVYLPLGKVPFLWIAGTNDFAYPLDSLQNSYRLLKNPPTLSVRVRMPHSQGDGQAPEEIRTFADQTVSGGLPLARITTQGRDGQTVWADYTSATPILRSELAYTTSNGIWKDRTWISIPAEIDLNKDRVSARIPVDVTACFFILVDRRGLRISSPHQTYEISPLGALKVP